MTDIQMWLLTAWMLIVEIRLGIHHYLAVKRFNKSETKANK